MPVLWDRQEERIVNNESADIVRMLDLDSATAGCTPRDLRGEIERLNTRIYRDLQNAVYEAGFARSQAAYEEAARRVFATLAWLEELLGERRYLAGDGSPRRTGACSPRSCASTRSTSTTSAATCAGSWTTRTCGATRASSTSGRASRTTVAIDQIRRHYYTTHDSLEPSRIIPIGPALDFAAPHRRGRARRG